MTADRIVLSGNEKILRPIITEVMAIYQMIGATSDDYYSIPINTYQETVVFLPQICLHFLEDENPELKENGLAKTTAEVSFRLKGETSQTLNEAKAKQWATRIKEFMGTGGGFAFTKGHLTCCYKDKQHGFDFQLYVQSESEAIKVIEKVCEIAEKEYFPQYLKTTTYKKEFLSIPPQQQVYGQERRKPREKPIAKVRFTRAHLHIHGLPLPVCLYDRTGKKLGLV